MMVLELVGHKKSDESFDYSMPDYDPPLKYPKHEGPSGTLEFVFLIWKRNESPDGG